MIEALGGAFGVFRAKPLSGIGTFHWSISVVGSARATLVSGFHDREFQFDVEATQGTSECLSIVLPRNGGMGVKRGSLLAAARQGTLLLYNTLEAENVVMYGQSNAIDELLLNWRNVAEILEQTFERALTGALDLSPELDLATPAGKLIGNLAGYAVEGMRDNGPLLSSPIAMVNITQALTDLIIRLIPHRLSHLLEKKPSLIAPWHVRRAIDFMQANIDQPITMAMVAEAAGVSLRTLQNGFRAFRETTPAAYLANLRLQAARLDLLDPINGLSVKDICLKRGFFHSGRFAGVYKETYGESPSETKRRSYRGSYTRAYRECTYD